MEGVSTKFVSMGIDRKMCLLGLGGMKYREVKDYALQSAEIVIYHGPDHHRGINTIGIQKDGSYDSSAISQ